MRVRELFRELRRRHVYRVAVAYLVTAWLLIQVASIVLPTFEAPDWVMKGLIGLLALLFPVAVALAWAFELTSEGVRRTPEEHEADAGTSGAAADPVQSTRRGGRTLTYGTVVMLAAAVGLLGWRMLGSARESIDTAPARSVAVLPFENLSADSSNAYFAGGMQDMILTKLAGIGDLTVIARSSTERYGSRPDDLGTVARELGVSALLQGSVRREGTGVLVNVQLVDPRTEEQLWAGSYPRTLDDVFGVESEVARRVADALRATLTPEEQERVAAPPTSVAAAYDLYLKAEAHARRAYDANALAKTELPRAIPLYERALDRDPDFALAWAALSRAHMNLYWYGPDRTEARLTAAREAGERALELRPDLGEAHLALALYEYWGRRSYGPALEHLERARTSLPSSARVEYYFASIARRQGQWVRAVAAFEQAALLDPRSPGILVQLARTHQYLRHYERADSVYGRAGIVGQDVGYDPSGAEAWNDLYWKGDLAPVREALAKIPRGSDRYEAYAPGFFLLAWYSRDFEGAAEAASSVEAVDWADPHNVSLPRRLYLAWAQERAGRTAEARASYEAVRSRVAADVEERPEDASLRLALGFALAGLGRGEEAVQQGRRAAELMPLSRDAVTGVGVLGWLARLYVRAGESESALSLLRRLMDIPAGLTVSESLLRIDPVWDPLREKDGFRRDALRAAG